MVGEEQITVSEKALAELKEEYEAVHKDTEEAQVCNHNECIISERIH